MASGTVGLSPPNGVQGSSASSNNGNSKPENTHEKEKRMGNSMRSPSQRNSNPFVITERRGEKQLRIASRVLSVRDFVLLKTLGTGQCCSMVGH